MSEARDLKGLRGWLILVGLGVVINPLRMLATYLPLYLPIFEDGTWQALTTVGAPAYHPLWGPILLGEMVFNLAIFVASLYLAYLFFSRHYRFPIFFIALVAVSLVFIPLDAWLVSVVLPDEPMFDPETAKELARTLVAVLIWVPYMLVSKRVKATFVEHRPTEQGASGPRATP